MNNGTSFCKNPACKAEIEPLEPFCRKCWTKNLTEEGNLVGADRVTAVSTYEELELAVKNYSIAHPLNEPNTEPSQFILVEGELSKDVFGTFNARLEYEAQWKQEIPGAMLAAGASALVTYMGIKGISNKKDDGKSSDIQVVSDFSDWLQDNIEQLAVAGGLLGAGGLLAFRMSSMGDRNQKYMCSVFARTIDELYQAGFRVRGNRGQYIVLERELRPIDIVTKATVDGFKGLEWAGEQLGVWKLTEGIQAEWDRRNQ
ncbi:MAG: hypothetical protein AAGA60_07625 [Cyanobacteria bacterium P01_E01_bin.42]